jgi:lipopolysaccharide biosynthesis regulator YciM
MFTRCRTHTQMESAATINASSTQRMSALRSQVEVARESVHTAFDAFRDILQQHRQQMLTELDTLHERYEQQMNKTFDTIARTSEKVHDSCR